MFFVYVLINNSGRHYVGMCSDFEKRLREHNSGKTKSTKGYRPWQLFFKETYLTRVEARAREKYLKSGIGREYISNWPRSSTE